MLQLIAGLVALILSAYPQAIAARGDPAVRLTGLDGFADADPPLFTRCTRHSAGRCQLDDPCYRADLRGWRYGDERDYSCFIYQRN